LEPLIIISAAAGITAVLLASRFYRSCPGSKEIGRPLDFLVSEESLSEESENRLMKIPVDEFCRDFVDREFEITPAMEKALGNFFKRTGRWQELVGLLNDDDPEHRASAAETLGRLRITQAADSLLEVMADKKEAVRLAASSGLMRMNTPEIAEPLAAALHYPKKWLPARVAEVLVSLGQDAVPALLRTLPTSSQEVTPLIIEVLGQIGDSRAVPDLVELLKHSPFSAVRISAAEALGEIGSEDTVMPLVDALHDQAWEVRAKAVGSLGRIGTPELMAHLEFAAGDEEWQVRAAAERALKCVGAD